MTKIKICGLMTADDAAIINRTHPDYAGVVFAAGRHQVDADQAAKLRSLVDDSIPLVGVFVDASDVEIIELYRKHTIQMAQLHGKEDPILITTLQAAGVPVIDVHVGSQPDPNTTADYLMVDSGQGSGKPLDWQLLPQLPSAKLFVAGGINPHNIKTVIDTLHPAVIDVSSGSEVNGKKDEHLIKTLVALAHQA
ncbi:phosphoribosylanthranilate isomerase [Lactobacillaceae bacterium Scapto_B20]